MSAKINVCGIVIGHISTLRTNGKINKGDLITFFLIPLLMAIIFYLAKVDISKDVVDVVVNSSAIFTGLLLNLLVLVYDQKSKLPIVNVAVDGWKKVEYKHGILSELYFNISYSTLISLLILVFSIIHLCIYDKGFIFEVKNIRIETDLSMSITTPVLVFFGLNLLFTIFMVLKRTYSLLADE